jgi:hypothetical protein
VILPVLYLLVWVGRVLLTMLVLLEIIALIGYLAGWSH